MLSEFTRSATATNRGITNSPGMEQVENLKALCLQVLEPLRQHAGSPIVIGSGYRSPTLNKAVGGVSNSQHMKGEAADIRIPDNATGEEWFVWLMEFGHFDQLIKERNRKDSPTFWIHVSFSRRHNRQHVINGLIKHKG